jgi:hypothetical protein
VKIPQIGRGNAVDFERKHLSNWRERERERKRAKVTVDFTSTQ